MGEPSGGWQRPQPLGGALGQVEQDHSKEREAAQAQGRLVAAQQAQQLHGGGASGPRLQPSSVPVSSPREDSLPPGTLTALRLPSEVASWLLPASYFFLPLLLRGGAAPTLPTC